MIKEFSNKLKIILCDLPYMRKWFFIQLKFVLKYKCKQIFGTTVNNKKTHHHLPQMILKNFSSKEGLVYRRDSSTYNSKEISISKKAGNINGQYFFKNKKTGEDDQIIEDFYGMLDDKGARILKKMKEGKYIFGNFENLMLSHFIASIIIRNPIFREFVGLSLSFFAKQNPEYGKIKLKTLEEIFINNKYDLNEYVLKDWAKSYDEGKSMKLLNSSMILSSFLLSHIARHIHFCNVNILEISKADYDNGYFFIISDNPVVVANENFMPKLSFYPPIDLTEVQLILPVSPRKVISFALYNKGGVFNIDKDIVKQINALSLKNSTRYSYSNKNHLSLEKQFI